MRPLRSPARAARTAHFTKAPAGGWRSLPKRSGTQDSSLLGRRQKKLVRAENKVSVLDGKAASSLRCGGRQGSSLRSDELRDHKTVASPLTAFLAAAHEVVKSCLRSSERRAFLIPLNVARSELMNGRLGPSLLSRCDSLRFCLRYRAKRIQT